MCAIEKLIKGADAEPNNGEPDIFVYQKVPIKHDQTLWGRREGEGRSIKKISPEERVLEPLRDRMIVWNMTIPERTR